MPFFAVKDDASLTYLMLRSSIPFMFGPLIQTNCPPVS